MKVKMNEYDISADLTGKDTLGIVHGTISDFWLLIDGEIKPEKTGLVNVHEDFIRNNRGLVAKEIHWFPQVTQGKNFSSLCIQEVNGNLSQVVWNFELSKILEAKKPWYKKIF